MTRLSKFSFIFVFLLLSSIFSLNAESISDKDFKFSLDIPEGFQIDSYTEDGMSYIFSHPNIPVTLVLRIYNNLDKTDSSSVLKNTLSKLSAKSDIDSFYWSKKTCAISSFSMTIDQNYKGWAICAPSLIEGSYINLMCYAPSDKEAACEQFIMSTLNGLCINPDYYYVPGIITSYAFPSQGKTQNKVTINNKTIISQIDKADIEASNFVIELEYSVLKLYAKHALWKEAWQRYYKMIYRDAFGRLEDFSEKTFEALYPLAEKENPSNPDITYAQYLLSWVQTFNYQRAGNINDSDFTSPLAAICGQGNDCDSRSMLLSILLNSIDVESILLFSIDYSHAMAATNIKAPGQTYKLEENQKEYIFGETTDNVTWGMIVQDQSDRSKWIPVTFFPD